MRTRPFRSKKLLLGAAAAAVLLWFGVLPRWTDAYTVSSPVTAGCHERIAADALRNVRLIRNTAAPLPVTRDEQALVDDLEFTPDDDMKDLGGVTLLLAVRDNDLKGRSGNDLTHLAGVHGDPDNQQEHCLRNQAEDEPGGSAAAVANCRAFIRGRVQAALDGLDANSAPDIAARTDLAVNLALRGGIDASLPTYYVRMGQALHAMEDAFTHAYRTPDGMKITVVLNWIDKANGVLDEARDGPAHVSELDVCDDPDALRATRRQLATNASIALLRVTLDPQTTKADKMTSVDGVLDAYLSYSPGCTYANGWCNAPERAYKDVPVKLPGCSCGGDPLGSLGALLGLAFLRRRGRRSTAVSAAIALVMAGAGVFAPGSARAAETAPSPTTTTAEAKAEAKAEVANPLGTEHAPPVPVTVPVAQPGPRDPGEPAWGAYLGFSASADKPALAGQLGIRRRMSTHWTLGWDAEWNPWASWYVNPPVRGGVFNTYGTVILRFPLAYEKFNVRTTLNLGLSYLLMDLYGAPKGSTGLYAGLSPLGVEYKLNRTFLLIINPLSIAVPAPQLQGVPLTYIQYRFSIGLGIVAG